jgi:hypothetical protein
VATDIAARGIDIDQLPFVINFDLQIYLKPMYIELEELDVLVTVVLPFPSVVRMNTAIGKIFKINKSGR